jgi:ABC-type transport system involved in cytochrome c biogenesis permease subunit
MKHATQVRESGPRALVARLLAVLALWVVASPAALAQKPEHPAPTQRTEPYPQELLDYAAEVGVQAGGRIKPLSTVADFMLLRLNSKRKVEVGHGLGQGDSDKLTSLEFLLDAWLYPEQARNYRVFYVRDKEILEAVGLDFPGRKRTERYTYEELAPARRQLMATAQAADAKQAQDRSPLESQTLHLASGMREFEDLFLSLEFTRVDLPLQATEEFRAAFPESRPGVSVLIEGGDRLRELVLDLGDAPDPSYPNLEALGNLESVLAGVKELGSFGLATFPPPESVEERDEWRTVDEVIDEELADGGVRNAGLDLIRAFEAMEATKDDPTALTAAVKRLRDLSAERAEARGEFAKIPMEVRFYKGKYFLKALAMFLGAFLFAALSWMAPGRGWLQAPVWLFGLGGLGYLTVGIVLRCILRDRPPVSTLYETILFITAVGVAVAMVTEWIQRQRFALHTAVLLGAAGMFLAGKYELREAITSGDTMPQLQAVLDTNFWLATHVTTVTMGYAAGLLAAALAHVWLFGQIFGIGRSNKDFYRFVQRAIYGVLCFGLLFAVVGTILGGVWANDSWGRFWGWDPKENGALLICLWMLMILHARLGGYIKQFGLAWMALATGPVVAFSWWGVNLMGVGLHSYGFTDGVLGVLRTYVVGEAVLAWLALVWYLFRGRDVGPAAGAAA